LRARSREIGAWSACNPVSAASGGKRFARQDRRQEHHRRGARENDELTFGVAGLKISGFTWSTSGLTWSSGIIKKTGSEESVLLKAVNWLHIFAQETSKVDVHYTKRKHATKPGARNQVWCGCWNSNQSEPKNWLNE
jgi:hypothetical protein